MTKPGTVIGIQVMLWTFTALGALGDTYFYVHLSAIPLSTGAFVLINGAFMTIQGLLSPVHIGRGRRWARNFALVNAVIGLILALLVIIAALDVVEEAPLPMIIGVVSTGLQGTLLGLLCSKSARQWVLEHRVRDGRVPAQPIPAVLLGGVAPGTIVEVEEGRPQKMPAGVRLVQIAVSLIALFPLAPGYVLISSALYERATYPTVYAGSPLAEHLLEVEWQRMIAWSVMMAVFLVLGIVSIVGLKRGRSWVRTYSRIWLGIVAVLAGMTADDAIHWLGDPSSYQYSEITRPAKLTMAVVSIATSVMAVGSFVMLFTPGVRRWTPRSKVAIAVQEVGPTPPGQAGSGKSVPASF